LNGTRYTRPSGAGLLGVVFKDPPKFFANPNQVRGLSSLFVFLDKTPQSNNC